MGAILILFLAFQCVWAGLSVADSLFLPKGLENKDGNTELTQPFGDGRPSHIQQLYGASEFASFGPGGGLITELRFRPDSQSAGAGTVDIPELQINMSTTLKTPDHLDDRLQANIGADESVVFPKSSIRFTYTVDPANVNSMSIVIPLPKPFYYQPLNGNLLVDFQVFKAPVNHSLLTSLVLDSEDVRGDSYSVLAGDFGTRASYGIITEFGFTSIPEPRGIWLLLSSVLVIWKLKGVRTL